jgi:biopolymer transport protein ExbB/TolQ
MDTIQIQQLGIALAAVVAAIAGFNTLIGRGPRGTVWIVAACLLTWGTVLPIVLRDPDTGLLAPEFDWLSTVLQLCGLVGGLLGIVDALQERTSAARHPIAQWALCQPLLWGLIACANFYALLYAGTIESPLLWRYTAGHPVEIVEAAFFFVGLAILLVRFGDVTGQLRSLKRATLGPIPAGGQAPLACHGLLTQLADLPHQIQQTYLARRLRDAIQFVHRKGSAENLDQHLRHLEELDAVQMHSGYATLRIIIWAIPILGFLGTVIGITVAIANLSPNALEQSMSEVTAGLGVAFDTTAEALALTMVLMFAKSLVERIEDRLLATVDARVSEELVGRFQSSTPATDPNVATIRRMSEQVIEAVEALAARQAEVWKATIHETHQQWADVSMAAGHIVKDSLSTAVKENLEQHARVLGQNVLKHADRLEASASQHVERLNRGGEEISGRLRHGMEKLGELLVEALERHGDVLTRSEHELAEGNRQHLSEVEAALGRSMVSAAERQEQLVRQSEDLLREMQVALVEAAGATVRQQEQLIRQADVLLKVVDATGQIRKLEESLNQNLEAVGQAHNFEEMALNLSAAIQLLSARLGHPQFSVRPRELSGDDATIQAA